MSTISQLYNQEKWLNERVFYTYEEIRGFAARFTNEEVDYISHAIGVLAVIKDEATVRPHTTRSPEFLGVKVNFGIGSKSNFAENVVIGLVDSGIWPEAESFNDAGLGPVPIYWNGYCESGDSFNSSFCNRKLIGARYFTKGFNFVKADKPTDHFGRDYDSPRDGSGHGTHTASTAAGALVDHANLFGFAEGTAKGIAHNARIAIYKACAFHWCHHSDILAAMESAIQDGVQILSLSIGGPETPYYASSIARGGFAAIKKGIFVTCAAGNNGPISGSVMNTAPWLTTVGAGSIDRSFPVDVMLGNGLIFTGSSLYPSNLTRTDAFPLVYDGFCRHLLKHSYNFKGKIVVCAPGGDKNNAFIIQSAGGAGFIELNGEQSGEQLMATAYPLPAATVGFEEGRQILIYIKTTKNPVARFVFHDATSPRKERAPALASFSARGPNPTVAEILKPDLIAPGLNILAAFAPNVPLTGSFYDKRTPKFTILSGTSMACPHVAGAAALLRGAHPTWSPAAIRSALMTTAGTSDNAGLPMVRLEDMKPATALGIGSGQINPELATDPGLIYDIDVPDYVHFLCSLGYTEDQMRILVEEEPNPCSGFSGSPGNLNYPSFSVLFRPNNNVHELTRTVTCVGELLPEIYEVNVVNLAIDKVAMTVKPHNLICSKIGEKHRYTIKFKTNFTAKHSSNIVEDMIFGSISWVSEKHAVRSPIAVMWSMAARNYNSWGHLLSHHIIFLALHILLLKIRLE
ncbi:unnamed protein product [Camellia sinensis]